MAGNELWVFLLGVKNEKLGITLSKSDDSDTDDENK